jgi:hypothetical protein
MRGEVAMADDDGPTVLHSPIHSRVRVFVKRASRLDAEKVIVIK